MNEPTNTKNKNSPKINTVRCPRKNPEYSAMVVTKIRIFLLVIGFQLRSVTEMTM